MKVKVRLFGTLSRHFSGYRPDRGIEVELSDGARVRDLLGHLEISKSQGGVAIVQGRVLKIDDSLGEATTVDLFQPVSGG